MAYTLGDIGNVPGQAFDFLKRQYVNLTKPGADDDDYTTRSAAIARQRKLADMLSQMGEQEQAVSTAGGITAPMSGMGALARGLTSFGGAYLSGKASADEAAATKAEEGEDAKTLRQMGEALAGTPQETVALAPTDPTLGQRNLQDIMSMSGSRQATPDELAAALGGNAPPGRAVMKNMVPGDVSKAAQIALKNPRFANQGLALQVGETQREANYLRNKTDLKDADTEERNQNIKTLQSALEGVPSNTPNYAQLVIAAKTGNVSLFNTIFGRAPQRSEATPDVIQTAQYLFPNDLEAQNVYIINNSPANLAETRKPNANDVNFDLEAANPDATGILGQTGLPLQAFAVLTGNAASLPRDSATRSAAFSVANKFLQERGGDAAGFVAQYQANTETLRRNIARVNQVEIMQDEIIGTIENLTPAAEAVRTGKLRIANVLAIAAGKELDSPAASEYGFQLQQLRSELAAYNAALQGRTGNNIFVQDQLEADRLIKDGLSMGGIAGIKKALQASTAKMTPVLNKNVDKAQKRIWELFGVGDKYKNKYDAATIENYTDAASVAAAYQSGTITRDEAKKIIQDNGWDK